MLTNELSQTNEPIPRYNRSEEKSDDTFYSEENIARLKESIEQLKRGQVVEKTFDKLRSFIHGNQRI